MVAQTNGIAGYNYRLGNVCHNLVDKMQANCAVINTASVMIPSFVPLQEYFLAMISIPYVPCFVPF